MLSSTNLKQYFFLIFCLLVAVVPTSMATPIIGWVEKVSIHPEGEEFKARIDTGAKTSSIDASNIQIKHKNGKKYINFSVRRRDGKPVIFERLIIRETKIKRDFGKIQIRPVIRLEICIGKIKKEVEVNLTDRHKKNYPVLIGRNYLAGNYLVDSSKTKTTSLACD
ncbi:MAG: RimK/LysX family protein [Gammaproteobacteria bacterium]|nr:RimK/LysX family protein [Gammaproteobacteria bacterium]